MQKPTSYTDSVEDLQRALLAMKRDILDCEPVAALNRIDALLDALVGDRPEEGEPGRWSLSGH